MEKTTIFAIILAVLALTVSFATAHGNRGVGPHHEEMEELLEEGTYQDFVDYRNGIGWNMMPWIDSEEAFTEMQERHELMEEYRGAMGGCHGGHYHREGH